MERTSYDEVRYPSGQFRRTHPLSVALPAALFGLPFAAPETARVLEIGCGEGGNLIPMAAAYPGARFLGFDLAGTAIEAGQQVVAGLGLTNIDLRRLDILDAGRALGQFDYIIVHGVYSWVPDPVREATLRVVQECLAPEGLAYISYNALPGCHLRLMMREMVLHHLRGLAGFEQRVAKAHEFLRLFLDNAPDDNPDAARLKRLCKEMLERDPHVLFHDELGDFYHPVYLHELVADAARFGLAAIGENSGPWWREELFPTPAGEAVTRLVGDDRGELHQYLDFLNVRVFRQSILTHGARVADRRIDHGRTRGLWIAGNVRCADAEPDLQSDAEVQFQLDEASVKLGSPALKQALFSIGAAWPRSVSGADLPDDPDVPELVLQLFVLNRLRLFAGPSPAAAAAGERPLASPVARAQLAGGAAEVCSLDHRVLDLGDPRDRTFLGLLDGTRSRAELALAMADRAQGPAYPVDSHLDRFARMSLLVR